MRSGFYWCVWLCLACLLAAPPPAFSASPLTGRYALILADPPAAQHLSVAGGGGAGRDYRQRILAAQATLRRDLEGRGYRATGAVQLLANAVFVQASEDRLAELRSLSGVKSVVPVHRFRRNLDKAILLENVPAAWAVLNGTGHAGAGIKIAFLDTGIDQTHPAFQDPSLSAPPGFPKCEWADCAFTSNKVIVARSYVSILAAGTNPGNPAADSRPDDVSVRDRVGHGTALAMIAAGMTNTGPADTITGIAPKAWLGSYKVFGSPGLNDFTYGDVIATALEDALNDGMDIVVLSFGSPAFSGPLDQGAACGLTGSDPCDFEASVVETAIQSGLTVAIAAGNDGDAGAVIPTRNTISSPATAPSAIAGGASTNSHVFESSVRTVGQNIPSNLQTMAAMFGDGPLPAGPLTAPVVDAAKLDGGTGRACVPLPAGSLNGAIALIMRSACNFAVKVAYAQNAGAVGVLIYMDSVGALFPPGGLTFAGIPTAMIGNADGTALKSYLAANPGIQVTLDPTPFPVDVSTYNQVASFSSRGPSIDYRLKPELVAVGTDVYMAAQRFDPNGEMYDPSGYTVADGTSFSAPAAAGTAALVKEMHPDFTAAQVKSALVNTATQDVTDNGATAGADAAGNGKLNAGGAVQTTITADPAAVSFGALNGKTLPQVQQLTIHYAGNGPATLTLGVVPRGSAPIVPALSQTSLSFAPGSPDQTVTLTLSGSMPAPGFYEGAVLIQGAGSSIRVPYIYVVGDGVVYNAIEISGYDFDGTVGQFSPYGIIAFRLTDRYGVSVPNVSVRWRVTQGGGAIRGADSRTDNYGIAAADVILGPNPGAQEFVATAGGFSLPFDGTARIQPVIAAGGVVSAASYQLGPGIAPGSYVSIFGTGLSDTTQANTFLPLPVVLNNVSVSFDVPSAGLSLPGRILYIGPNQINVQVPWELQDQTSVQMKVTIGYNPGQVYTVKVSNYAPAVFLTGEGTAAALDANNVLIGSANPARRNGTIQVFANGLGPVGNQPASGEAAKSDPLSRTGRPVTATIGGVAADVSFSGLAPGFEGLNQVNITVPPNAPTGPQPLVLTTGGFSSPRVNIPVQ